MASKKSVVDQTKLRQMMAQMKQQQPVAAAAAGSNSKMKKYKLSARETSMLEEEKRRKIEKKMATAAPALPKDFFERVPVKSILKNSGAAGPPAVTAATSLPSLSGKKRRAEGDGDKAGKKTKKVKMAAVVPADDVEMEEEGATAADVPLPEGFFDDPIKDAKVS
jgi:hypothetical protein